MAKGSGVNLKSLSLVKDGVIWVLIAANWNPTKILNPWVHNDIVK